MNEYFEVGQILTTHGLKGEVKVNSITDFPEERFSEGSRLFVDLNGEMKELTVESARKQKQFYLIFFEEIVNIEEAEKICHHQLYVADTNRQDLPDGSYYYKDIIGCPIYDHETGEKLGILNSIETPGANDIWEVKPKEGKSFWIPNIASVVNKVDLLNKRIEVTLLEGLR